MADYRGTININKFDNYVILKLAGNFSSVDEPSKDDATKLRDTMKQLVNEGYRRMILDFRAVSFFASNAMGALISGHSRMREERGKIIIFKPLDYIKESFSITHIDNVMPIVTDYETLFDELYSKKGEEPEMTDTEREEEIEELKKNLL